MGAVAKRRLRHEKLKMAKNLIFQWDFELFLMRRSVLDRRSHPARERYTAGDLIAQFIEQLFGVLLVVFTTLYAPFGRSFATKNALLSTKTKVRFLNDVCLSRK